MPQNPPQDCPQNGPQDWWKGATIYQIYPRSFMDSNGDGVGDLRGITGKMDYLRDLGVDALWISPFFPSPMKDFGYDIADYCGVDPLFGDLADFDALLAAAHERGLRVIIDMVLSHTSDRHEWFAQSRQDRTNPRADWYVWADPKPDGAPPNNWQSVFGGPSWHFDMRRGQYYLHNFLPAQPDLNLHNPAVRAALLAACRFWLDRGVDGFRLDATTFYFHDRNLPDNPPNPDPRPSAFNIDFPVPYSMQIHKYDSQIPETILFLQDIRALLDEYPDRMAVAEVGGEDGVALAAQFTAGPHRLHTAYNFSLISGSKASAPHIRDAVQSFTHHGPDSWPSWAFSNHDVVRVATRWAQENEVAAPDKPAFARLLMALLLSLRGTAFIYQGEELGLEDAPVSFDDIQDPWGKYLYPLWQGRDGCRTPMPWDNRLPQAGFSTAAKTWLPLPASHHAAAVASQEADPATPLRFTRAFLRWRKTQSALIAGDIDFAPAGQDDILAFTRRDGKNAIFCAFNLSGRILSCPATVTTSAHSLFAAAGQDGQRNGAVITLPPYGFYFGTAIPDS